METGHVNNVANLNTLISRCLGYGARYNPTNPSLTIANLQSLYAGANAALADVNAAKPPYLNAVSERQVIFQDMEKLSTRVLNALSSSTNVQDNLVANTKTIIRKIRGSRKEKLAPSPTSPAATTATVTATAAAAAADTAADTATATTTAAAPSDTPVQISASQQSYDQQVEHFTKLISLVGAVPVYNPNETELQSPSLNTFLTQLKNANAAVVSASTPYLTALQSRNNTIYTPKTGLVDLALAVKKYVKSVKTITLAEFRQISGLTFHKPKRKK